MKNSTTHETNTKNTRSRFSFKIALWGGLATIALIGVVTFFLGGTQTAEGFKDFQDLKLYATMYEEHPKMDNDNIIKPDYTTFFASWQKGFFTRLLNRFLHGLHLKKRIPWSPEFFKKLIVRVTKMRMEAGFKSDVILKMAATEKTNIVIVGNLQAAFHSLVQNLGEMIKLGILDEKLHLCKSDHILIFLGNAINRAPYSMETLSVIARLIEENPKTVFYLKGNHEDNNYWHDYTLKQELMSKAAGLSTETIPLEAEVNAFFATLPLALYVGVPPEPQQKYVRISHEGKDSPDLDETKLAAFLHAPLKVKEPDIVEVFNIKENKEAPGDPVQLAALIRSEKKRKTFQTMDGLRLLTPEEGTVAWTILSCPTKVYQLGIKFFYDAFGIVSAGKKFDDWTITIHNQDVRVRQGYATRICNIVSGTCDKKDFTGAGDGAQEVAAEKTDEKKKKPEASEKSIAKEETKSEAKPEKTPKSVEKEEDKKEVAEKGIQAKAEKEAVEFQKEPSKSPQKPASSDSSSLELTPAEPEQTQKKTDVQSVASPAPKSEKSSDAGDKKQKDISAAPVPLPSDLASDGGEDKKVSELLERKKELEEDLVSVIQEIDLTTHQAH